MEFVLREFRPEDFERLWRIDQECFVPGIAYSRLELAAYIRRPGSFTLVADAAHRAPETPQSRNPVGMRPESNLLGFIVAVANRKAVGHILTIDVSLAGRRFGVGSKLLETAEQRLRATGCDRVVLETAVDNSTALAFYKKHLYDIVKTIPRYYSNGVDAFVLEKELLAQSEVEGQDNKSAAL